MSQSIPFIDLRAQYDLLRDQVQQRLTAVLEHGQYVMGPEVAELERRLAEYVGVRHCIAASSGTDTLLMGLMALGVGPNDEVITTPFTFIATGEVIALLGARPVFVDIEPDSFNLDAARLAGAITSRTKAIMPVSLFGQCPDFAAINDIARNHGLPVIEDGAQSFGAMQHGRRSCALSTIGSTSFFPSKPLGAYGDGGALFTDDDALAVAMREIRSHGQERRYHHVRLGINGRLDTMQAAVLLAKLDRFDWEVRERQHVAARYNALLAESSPWLRAPTLRNGNTSVYAQYTLRLPDRDRVARTLAAAGVPTAVHYPVPLHRQPAFAALAIDDGAFPESERAAREVLSLPMGPYITEAQQAAIVAALASATAPVARVFLS